MRFILQLGAIFSVVTLAEIWLLLWMGSWMGPTATFALVLVSGFAGAWLVRHQGLRVLTDMREDLTKGLPPGSRVVEGVLVLICAAFLVTPGILTDAAGFIIVLPPVRRWLAPRILDYGMKRLAASGASIHVGGGQTPRRDPNAPSARPADPGNPFHDPRFDD